MNLTHLRAFHLVASYGSYTSAAKAAGVSQP
ncbi:MAG: LysR family transcriptional regulator, partial [Specibacter sp.]